jgi:microcin C transport system substrate-binding protein
MITRKGLRGHFRTSALACFGHCYTAFSARVCPTLRGVANESPIRAHARRLPLSAWTSRAEAQEKRASLVWRHGVSLFGDLKYPSGFKQFDYVNANAPRGGAVRQIALGTYDNFNMVVDGVKGALILGIDLNYDTLLVAALDEVSSGYGLIAEAVSYPDDFSSTSFRLRAEAKWHDGTAVTTEDVIFSFDTFKKLSPQAGANYQHVIRAAKTGEREVTFTFDGPGNRGLPQVLGQLTILPKAWWQGIDTDGKRRDVGSTTLEPPLGSGPYRIKEFSPGHSIAEVAYIRSIWRDCRAGPGNFAPSLSPGGFRRKSTCRHECQKEPP